jgi:inner membrane protein
VYGTQLLLPLTDTPYGVGSLFIVDPAYTLPLLLGVLAACAVARRSGTLALRLNALGLLLSTAYIGWSVAAQAHVMGLARETLAAQGLAADRVLVTPAPLNTLLWRVVVVDEASNRYREGFYGFLDAPSTPAQRISFDTYARGNALAAELAGLDGVQRIQAFSKGFWAMEEREGRVRITDLRMGQAPHHVFNFEVAERRAGGLQPLQPAVAAGGRGDPGAGLSWLWRRVQGEPLPPPR